MSNPPFQALTQDTLGERPPRKSIIKGNSDEALVDSPSSIYRAWAQKYGPIYKFFTGRIPIVVITSPELIREVCITKFDYFVNRALPPGIFSNSESIISARDDTWKKLRRTVSPAFNGIHLKAMIPTMIQVSDAFLDVLQTKANTNNEINIDESFSQITLQILVATAFGEHVAASEESYIVRANKALASKIPDNVTLVCSILPTFVIKPIFQLIERFPPAPLKVIFGSKKFLDEKAMNIIQKKRNEHDLKEDNFISSLIKCQDQETGNYLTDKEIRDSSQSFIIAGQHTTRTTMSLIIYITTQYPEVEAKMIQEIDTFFPDRTTPKDFEDLKKLEYTTMVVNEVLRLHAPAPLLMRESSCDIDVGGYKIPANTKLIVPICTIHTDPKIWGEDVKEFKPERWLNPPSDLLSFVPFGAGNRSCIGMRFALMEIKILLVRIFQRFSFKLDTNKTAQPLTFKEGLLFELETGVHVNVIERKKEGPLGTVTLG
eukprot:TRINITY_DN3609_c0_g1_i3.p1 TRINITY_DN3609_c0_g1~~TRINITY_DN3609_c0_g1_i3.p1  ORF type:complete len:488 (+),score=67.30 TRINITY_DN3609_c0_g1_i3:415-1878(+)